MSTIEAKQEKLLALRNQTRQQQNVKESRLNELKEKRLGLSGASKVENKLDNVLNTPLAPEEPLVDSKI